MKKKVDSEIEKNNEEEIPKKWKFESYLHQSRNIWPGRGNHILAQYDNDSVVVYQAFREKIASYAVKHKKFTGCEVYKEARMTWIKPNFMWMMFRSRWANKPGQKHILAIWVKRSAFDSYLENARQKGNVREFKGTVRLQWDPDKYPRGDKHPYRRAIQLGLRGIKSFASGEDILWIEDITEFVKEQWKYAKLKKLSEDLLVSRERIYVPESLKARKAVSLSEPPKNYEKDL